MSNFFKILLVNLVAFLPINAVLPPLYQTANEIKAILASEDLGVYLTSGEPIMMIEKVENGYEIKTNRHKLNIEIIYQPMKHPGPAQFVLKFQKAIPL